MRSIYWGILLLTQSIVIASCKKMGEEFYIDIEYEYFENGDFIIKGVDKGRDIFELGFSKDGNLDYLSNYPKGAEQFFSFFENGILRSKLRIDTLGKTQDRAYYFYENSGNLSGDYFYKDGLKVGSAVTYHDSTDHIKSLMLYNDEGQMYWRKTFDIYGKLIKEEGRKYEGESE